jgi:hypothetical protein
MSNLAIILSSSFGAAGMVILVMLVRSIHLKRGGEEWVSR